MEENGGREEKGVEPWKNFRLRCGRE